MKIKEKPLADHTMKATMAFKIISDHGDIHYLRRCILFCLANAEKQEQFMNFESGEKDDEATPAIGFQ